jgi:hydrocephalus-inducing protein
MIICRGVGLEPQVIIGQMHGATFEPTTSIVFNPILTHSHGDEQEIVIRNPCTFPVEIYNLEFDKQYLEEEKVNAFVFGLFSLINGFSVVGSSSVTRL